MMFSIGCAIAPLEDHRLLSEVHVSPHPDRAGGQHTEEGVRAFVWHRGQLTVMEVTGLAGLSGISPRLEVAEVFVASLGVREIGPMVITLNFSVLTNILCWRGIPLIILCTNSEMTGLSDQIAPFFCGLPRIFCLIRLQCLVTHDPQTSTILLVFDQSSSFSQIEDELFCGHVRNISQFSTIGSFLPAVLPCLIPFGIEWEVFVTESSVIKILPAYGTFSLMTTP